METRCLNATYHFLSSQQEFGVVYLFDDGSVKIWSPVSLNISGAYDATTIEQYMQKEADGGITRETVLDAIGILLRFCNVRGVPNFKVPRLQPNCYHPRIWRGIYNPSNPFKDYSPVKPRKVYGSAYVQSIVAVQSLFDSLTTIFRVIEPSSVNGVAYGHRTRELLILGCTEVEAAWRGVWTANHHGDGERRLSTNEYVQLIGPLGLKTWSVKLTDYPEYGVIKPFQTWDASSPTQTLPWYAAYNDTKHDREAHFCQATLDHLISTMAALHILLAAQWGPGIFSILHEAVPSPFHFLENPVCTADEIYSPLVDEHGNEGEWTQVQLWE